MKPVYKSERYYVVTEEYYNTDTDTSTLTDGTIVKDKEELHSYISTTLATYKERASNIELQHINIEHKEEVLDYSEIIDWVDVRAGDYAIHIHSKNNESSSIELGYDFYVAKLNRDKVLVVEKYYICWHAYQGAFLISQYQEGSSDKATNIPRLTIYDERLFPNLDEIETDTGKRWLYSKVAKFASPYAIEEPDREQNVNIEV